MEAAIAADRLDACTVEVEVWLKASRLILNPNKTQAMWLDSALQKSARNLGVVCENLLSMSAHVAAVFVVAIISYGSRGQFGDA